MKKIFLFFIVLLIYFSTSAQEGTQPDTRQVKKERNWKSSAYVLFGCGSTALLSGLAFLTSLVPRTKRSPRNIYKGLAGVCLLFISIGCYAGSIIIFLAS